MADEIQSLLCILLDRLKVEKRENTRVRSFCHSCGRDPSLSFLPVVTFDSSFLCLARKRRKGLFFSSVNAQSSSHTAEKPDPSHMRPEENGERSRRGPFLPPSPPFPKQIRSQSHTKGRRYDNDFSPSPKEENSKFLTISRIPSPLSFFPEQLLFLTRRFWSLRQRRGRRKHSFLGKVGEGETPIAGN